MSSSLVVRFVLLIFVVACTLIAISVRAEILLDANFDAEVVDHDIPLGGAAAGEPIAIDSFGMAVVRQGAFATPSLQVTDPSTTDARYVRFEFLNSAEVATGLVYLSLTANFSQLGNYSFGLREQGTLSHDFFDFYTSDLGSLFVSTSTFFSSIPYSAATPLHFNFVFDMDSRTVSGSVNGTVLATNLPMGIADRGLGTLLVGHGFDADLNGKLDIDDLLVESLPQEIFIDGFEN